MIATLKMEDGNRSEKKIEVKEDLRTIECLRGRLLAERQASKVANEDAEQMGNKLIELENLLKEETKLRKKAEKKLRLFKKKLESLNISIFPCDKSEESSLSSDIFADSCSKSSTTTSTSSGLKDSEESESKSQQQITTTPEEPEMSKKLDNYSSECEDSNPEIKNSMESENASDNEDYYVDNSSALVLVSNPIPEVKKIIRSGNARDALEALRIGTEMIQNSMEEESSIHMIRVGHY